jgi:hypothetical protein
MIVLQRKLPVILSEQTTGSTYVDIKASLPVSVIGGAILYILLYFDGDY